MDRSELLKRAAELGHKDPHGLTDAELESWCAETEASADFWDRWDADMARDMKG